MANHEPFFRAPKGTPNFNAFRTLLFGLAGALVILLASDPAVRAWDRYFRAVPWISSELRVIEAGSPYGVLIDDLTTARHYVIGDRRVWVEDRNGHRFCDTERHDAWIGRTGHTWTFAAFTGGCPVPAARFRVCTKFMVESARGTPGVFGPFCSEPFIPRGHDA